MRRTLLKVTIFALTFGLGVGVSACWRLYQWSLLPFEVSSDVAEAKEPGITIVGGMSACGPEATYHTLELSDGTTIFQSCERLSSPSAARRTFEKRLVNAEVAERSQQLDEKGRITGEKVLIISPRVMRLGLNGNSLCITDAPSFPHLRLYEAGALHYSIRNSGND